MASPCIADTCSVDLEVDPGTGNLTADVILDPAGAIRCTPGQGLGVNIGTSGCGVDLSITGNALVADLDLSATGGLECAGGELGINLDSNACNGLTLSASGLQYNEHTCRLLNGGDTVPVGLTGVTEDIYGFLVDVGAFNTAYGLNLQEISVRSQIAYTNTTCRTVNFLSTYGSGPVTISAVNGWALAVGTRNYLNCPATGAGSSVPSIQYNATSAPFTAGNTLGITFPPPSYTTNSFLLPGQTATNEVSLFVQVLAVGGASAYNSIRIGFGANQGLYVWTR